MSDTYFVTINCPYCGEENPDEEALEHGGGLGIPYKDEYDNIYTCDNCGEKFRIVRMGFRAEKIESE